MAEKSWVAITMGSDSDLPVMAETAKVLEEFGVPFKITVASAHRSPETVKDFIRQAEQDGTEVIIAAAGGAAHLAGVIAAETIIPVLGVPIKTEVMGGLDSLLAMVQMPGGVPVAVMAVGKGGATNAGVFAVQMLSGKHPELAVKLKAHKAKLAQKTKDRAAELEKLGYAKYLEKNSKK